MSRRYRGAHERPPSRRAVAAAGGAVMIVVVGGGAGLALRPAGAGVTPAARPAPSAVPATFVYDPAGYRRAIESQLGHALTDANFAKLESIDRETCSWDADKFAGWVAVQSDGNTLPRLGLSVQYVCPARLPDVTAALRKIADAQQSCAMPGIDDPHVRELVAAKPAQSALLCLTLTKPITVTVNS